MMENHKITQSGRSTLFQRLGGVGKKLRRTWVDGEYRGQLIEWMIDHFQFRLHSVLRLLQQQGFVLLLRRWVVERTFSWLNPYRRLSKDYEVLTHSSKVMIYLAMTRLMLRRLRPS